MSNNRDLAIFLFGSADYGVNPDEIDSVIGIVGMEKFDFIVNTVLMYPQESMRAAWVKYSAIEVESAVSIERQAAYMEFVHRPHYSDISVLVPVEVEARRQAHVTAMLDPEAVRALVARLRDAAYRR